MRRIIARAVPLALAAPGNAQRRCRMHAELITCAPSAAVAKMNKYSDVQNQGSDDLLRLYPEVDARLQNSACRSHVSL